MSRWVMHRGFIRAVLSRGLGVGGGIWPPPRQGAGLPSGGAACLPPSLLVFLHPKSDAPACPLPLTSPHHHHPGLTHPPTDLWAGVWQGPCRFQGAARLAPADGQEAGRPVVSSLRLRNFAALRCGHPPRCPWAGAAAYGLQLHIQMLCGIGGARTWRMLPARWPATTRSRATGFTQRRHSRPASQSASQSTTTSDCRQPASQAHACHRASPALPFPFSN